MNSEVYCETLVKLTDKETDGHTHIEMTDSGMVAEGVVILSFVSKEIEEEIPDDNSIYPPFGTIDIEMTITQWEEMRDRIEGEIESFMMKESSKMAAD